MRDKRPPQTPQEVQNTTAPSIPVRPRSNTTSRTTRRARRDTVAATSFVTVATTASLSRASALRTVEILWEGRTALGFTLKRKRTGTILVSTLTREALESTSLKIGSELRLVGGFPVSSLTLEDVKKVILRAPKPVSLVFLNAENVILGPVHPINDFNDFSSIQFLPSTSLRRSTSMCTRVYPSDESDSDKSTALAPLFCHSPSKRHESKKRKVSKLQAALSRLNQLLHRPVRQAGLHFGANTSIVV